MEHRHSLHYSRYSQHKKVDWQLRGANYYQRRCFSLFHQLWSKIMDGHTLATSVKPELIFAWVISIFLSLVWVTQVH